MSVIYIFMYFHIHISNTIRKNVIHPHLYTISSDFCNCQEVHIKSAKCDLLCQNQPDADCHFKTNAIPISNQKQQQQNTMIMVKT